MLHFFCRVDHQVTENSDTFTTVVQIGALEQLRGLEIVQQFLRKVQTLGNIDAGTQSVLAVTGESINISCLTNLRHSETGAKVDPLARPQEISPLVLTPYDTFLLVTLAVIEGVPAGLVAICKADHHLFFQVKAFKELQEDGVRLSESFFTSAWVGPKEHVLDPFLEGYVQEYPTGNDEVLA